MLADVRVCVRACVHACVCVSFPLTHARGLDSECPRPLPRCRSLLLGNSVSWDFPLRPGRPSLSVRIRAFLPPSQLALLGRCSPHLGLLFCLAGRSSHVNALGAIPHNTPARVRSTPRIISTSHVIQSANAKYSRALCLSQPLLTYVGFWDVGWTQ
ncbi:hypothetical protein K431DRAFT_108187 [Polychaeton citri CBS 116435]|uniref:Uncharacterized protein n=1 Tax=Polychaeton citri CBS 116435 TaxID=1314669 RepID=A0A9P4Q530_9PEZI|nr:hypothetical protein K431DRAFT_108187 [Polychaeton citri CBS 116435]